MCSSVLFFGTGASSRCRPEWKVFTLIQSVVTCKGGNLHPNQISYQTLHNGLCPLDLMDYVHLNCGWLQHVHYVQFELQQLNILSQATDMEELVQFYCRARSLAQPCFQGNSASPRSALCRRKTKFASVTFWITRLGASVFPRANRWALAYLSGSLSSPQPTSHLRSGLRS